MSQVLLEIPCVGDIRNTFGIVQKEVLRWLNNRAGTKLPDEAWAGRTFNLNEVGSQLVEAVNLDSDVWAARLDDADKEVAQRSWTTEFVIRSDPNRENTILFGCRLSCIAPGENPMFILTIPGVVRQVNDRLGGSIDGRPLSQSAWRVLDDGAVNDLVDSY